MSRPVAVVRITPEEQPAMLELLVRELMEAVAVGETNPRAVTAKIDGILNVKFIGEGVISALSQVMNQVVPRCVAEGSMMELILGVGESQNPPRVYKLIGQYLDVARDTADVTMQGYIDQCKGILVSAVTPQPAVPPQPDVVPVFAPSPVAAASSSGKVKVAPSEDQPAIVSSATESILSMIEVGAEDSVVNEINGILAVRFGRGSISALSQVMNQVVPQCLEKEGMIEALIAAAQASNDPSRALKSILGYVEKYEPKTAAAAEVKALAQTILASLGTPPVSVAASGAPVDKSFSGGAVGVSGGGFAVAADVATPKAAPKSLPPVRAPVRPAVIPVAAPASDLSPAAVRAPRPAVDFGKGCVTGFTMQGDYSVGSGFSTKYSQEPYVEYEHIPGSGDGDVLKTPYCRQYLMGKGDAGFTDSSDRLIAAPLCAEGTRLLVAFNRKTIASVEMQCADGAPRRFYYPANHVTFSGGLPTQASSCIMSGEGVQGVATGERIYGKRREKLFPNFGRADGDANGSGYSFWEMARQNNVGSIVAVAEERARKGYEVVGGGRREFTGPEGKKITVTCENLDPATLPGGPVAISTHWQSSFTLRKYLIDYHDGKPAQEKYHFFATGNPVSVSESGEPHSLSEVLSFVKHVRDCQRALGCLDNPEAKCFTHCRQGRDRTGVYIMLNQVFSQIEKMGDEVRPEDVMATLKLSNIAKHIEAATTFDAAVNLGVRALKKGAPAGDPITNLDKADFQREFAETLVEVALTRYRPAAVIVAAASQARAPIPVAAAAAPTTEIYLKNPNGAGFVTIAKAGLKDFGEISTALIKRGVVSADSELVAITVNGNGYRCADCGADPTRFQTLLSELASTTPGTITTVKRIREEGDSLSIKFSDHRMMDNFLSYCPENIWDNYRRQDGNPPLILVKKSFFGRGVDPVEAAKDILHKTYGLPAVPKVRLPDVAAPARAPVVAARRGAIADEAPKPAPEPVSVPPARGGPVVVTRGAVAATLSPMGGAGADLESSSVLSPAVLRPRRRSSVKLSPLAQATEEVPVAAPPPALTPESFSTIFPAGALVTGDPVVLASFLEKPETFAQRVMGKTNPTEIIDNFTCLCRAINGGNFTGREDFKVQLETAALSLAQGIAANPALLTQHNSAKQPALHSLCRFSNLSKEFIEPVVAALATPEMINYREDAKKLSSPLMQMVLSENPLGVAALLNCSASVHIDFAVTKERAGLAETVFHAAARKASETRTGAEADKAEKIFDLLKRVGVKKGVDLSQVPPVLAITGEDGLVVISEEKAEKMEIRRKASASCTLQDKFLSKIIVVKRDEVLRMPQDKLPEIRRDWNDLEVSGFPDENALEYYIELLPRVEAKGGGLSISSKPQNRIITIHTPHAMSVEGFEKAIRREMIADLRQGKISFVGNELKISVAEQEEEVAVTSASPQSVATPRGGASSLLQAPSRAVPGGRRP